MWKRNYILIPRVSKIYRNELEGVSLLLAVAFLGSWWRTIRSLVSYVSKINSPTKQDLLSNSQKKDFPYRKWWVKSQETRILNRDSSSSFTIDSVLAFHVFSLWIDTWFSKERNLIPGKRKKSHSWGTL